MMTKVGVIGICLIALVLLAGCKIGSDSGSSSFSSSSGSSSVDGSLDILESSPEAGDDSIPSSTAHHPEPITLALFGSGAAAFAFLKRKKRKK